jgi:hypothetical protein
MFVQNRFICTIHSVFEVIPLLALRKQVVDQKLLEAAFCDDSGPHIGTRDFNGEQ